MRIVKLALGGIIAAVSDECETGGNREQRQFKVGKDSFLSRYSWIIMFIQGFMNSSIVEL